uniref:Uncharacterized protein n=1 Tax=Oryza nivara TaxID=4536 RepID=A0A0E0H0Q2_ORYNI
MGRERRKFAWKGRWAGPGRVGSAPMASFPRFIWAAPFVGVVGEMTTEPRGGERPPAAPPFSTEMVTRAAAGDLSLSLSPCSTSSSTS